MKNTHSDRIEMNQRERDILKELAAVLAGHSTQAAAAKSLDLSVRQVRRLLAKFQSGDHALVHGLRGKPSNHQLDPEFNLHSAVAIRAFSRITKATVKKRPPVNRTEAARPFRGSISRGFFVSIALDFIKKFGAGWQPRTQPAPDFFRSCLFFYRF
jgi:hypothetical protein